MRPIIALALAIPAVVFGAASAQARKLETAVFAGGCFWSAEHDIEKTPGVVGAVAGYTGGKLAHPTYEQVGTERTGHFEAVKVTYDPAKISYPKLLDAYWRTIDPTDADGQFCDKGPSYRSVVFVASPEQRRAAEAQKLALNQTRFKGAVATEIRDATAFWPAEGYHQHYADKNPMRYGLYRTGCGRDARLKAVWGGR